MLWFKFFFNFNFLKVLLLFPFVSDYDNELYETMKNKHQTSLKNFKQR